MNSVLKKFTLSNIGEKTKAISKHVEDLNRDGITLLGPVFTDSQIKDIYNNLEKKKVYNGMFGKTAIKRLSR